MTQRLDDYYAALKRLKDGNPENVPKGTKITNDAVSLEAGRGKGTIKKSRPVFEALIKAIDDAAAERSTPKNEQKDRLAKAKAEADLYRSNLEASLAREVSLLCQVYDLKKRIAKLTGGKVLPLHGLAKDRRPSTQPLE